MWRRHLRSFGPEVVNLNVRQGQEGKVKYSGSLYNDVIRAGLESERIHENTEVGNITQPSGHKKPSKPEKELQRRVMDRWMTTRTAFPGVCNQTTHSQGEEGSYHLTIPIGGILINSSFVFWEEA